MIHRRCIRKGACGALTCREAWSSKHTALRRRWSVCRLGGLNRVQGGPYTAEELFEQVAQAGAVAYKGCGAARFHFFDAPCLETTISKALSYATIAGAVILGGRQGAVCASVGRSRRPPLRRRFGAVVSAESVSVHIRAGQVRGNRYRGRRICV